ncbi:MAG: hypothetical protein WC451_04955 [Patescibacteria group bacterium]
MTTIINWAKLVKENRAKSLGISWTPAEIKAIHEDGMNPDDVRAGFLSKADVEKANAEPGEKKLRYMNRAELIEVAKSLNVNFNESVVTRGDLILEIENKKEALSEDNAQKPQDNPNSASPSLEQ